MASLVQLLVTKALFLAKDVLNQICQSEWLMNVSLGGRDQSHSSFRVLLSSNRDESDSSAFHFIVIVPRELEIARLFFWVKRGNGNGREASKVDALRKTFRTANPVTRTASISLVSLVGRVFFFFVIDSAGKTNELARQRRRIGAFLFGCVDRFVTRRVPPVHHRRLIVIAVGIELLKCRLRYPPVFLFSLPFFPFSILIDDDETAGLDWLARKAKKKANGFRSISLFLPVSAPCCQTRLFSADRWAVFSLCFFLSFSFSCCFIKLKPVKPSKTRLNQVKPSKN